MVRLADLKRGNNTKIPTKKKERMQRKKGGKGKYENAMEGQRIAKIEVDESV